MVKLEEYKPLMAMTSLQFLYSGVTLSSRATMVNGTSPRVFILYRQAFATIFIFPFVYFSRRNKKITPLNLKSFLLIFMLSILGISINQNLYFEGLYLSSSTMGSAMSNTAPAITFLISYLSGYEKVNLKNVRGLAKITGTSLCVAAAISMTLFRGPKILNSQHELPIAKSILGDSKDQNMWLIGCLLVFCSNLAWSSWLTLQVPVSAYYPDHLSLVAWMCLFGTLQSAVITFFIEKDPNAWILHSYYDLATCIYAGIVASALSYTLQSWVTSKRGPLYSAMFSPLGTVIVLILASIFLKEEIYTGSLIGGLGVIIGLYIVLWGKAKDLTIQEQRDNDQKSEVKIQIEDSSDKDLKKPLLSEDRSIDQEIQPQQHV